MDPVRNPFAPGAGSAPPELSGRNEIIRTAEVALQRVVLGKPDKSQILLGLRGTGKTVLLRRIEDLAKSHAHFTSFIEAPEKRGLAELLAPKLRQTLLKLSNVESAKALTVSAMRAFQSFVGSFQVSYGDLSIGVEPELGTADSGNLEYDLTDLFERVGLAAKAAKAGWTLLIDEVQYLSQRDLSALIVAINYINQKRLPILLFGAGLPQLAALLGDAKSYAERLFNYPPIGPLDDVAATEAIRQPLTAEDETIDGKALKMIVDRTQGYPYFLQEWGHQAWNIAVASPISSADVEAATKAALQRLDDGFFRVRFDRLTPKEREYVNAMAELGDGPYRSADIATLLKETVQSLGPRRAKIIHKGMIYSPAHGDIAFTVPMFADFLRRIQSPEIRK